MMILIIQDAANIPTLLDNNSRFRSLQATPKDSEGYPVALSVLFSQSLRREPANEKIAETTILAAD